MAAGKSITYPRKVKAQIKAQNFAPQLHLTRLPEPQPTATTRLSSTTANTRSSTPGRITAQPVN